MSKHFHFDVHGYSDIGLARKNNEDVWKSYPEKGCFIIADGMGGHQAGEVAAKEASQFFIKSYFSLKLKEKKKHIVKQLSSLIDQTNHHVYSLSIKNKFYKGMGTTLCCLTFIDQTAFFAHVGDSRIYHFSNNNCLCQLTKDHSLANKLGCPSYDQSTHLPANYRNIITRAIGTTSFVKPDIAHIPIQIGDQFVLCTDGLSDYISSEDLKEIISSKSSLFSKVKKLIKTAKINGSNDNITVLLLKIIPLEQ